MKLSSLSKTYQGFAYFTFSILIDGKKWYPSQDFMIESFEVELSNTLEANGLNMSIISILNQDNLLSQLQTGAAIVVSAGYQGKETILFQGYLHTIELIQQVSGFLNHVIVYAQDVKGLMMLRKQLSSTIGKKKSSLVSDILQYPLYKGYVKKVAIKPLSGKEDVTAWLDGKSDYDVLTWICEDTFSTCFVSKDTLYFQPKWDAGTICLEIDQDEGITYLSQKTTVEDQCGTILVQACDDMKNKKQSKLQVNLSGKPQAKRMSTILSKTQLTLVDQGFHQLDAMKQLAEHLAEEVAFRYGTICGECILLPELDCGSLLQINQFADQKSKQGIITHVTHSYDATGFHSSFEASLKKG